MPMSPVRVLVEGTMPLMMAHPQLSDPLSPHTQSIAEISGKRIKTVSDHGEIAHRKWLGSIYYDDADGPYLPAENLWRSFIDGGRQSKDGKLIERGVECLSSRLPLIYEGPRTLKGLWGDGNTKWVDRRAAKVGVGKKVVACRPIFPEWSCEALFGLDDEVIDRHTFRRIVETAGQRCGVGTYRLLFGRYRARVESA